MGVKKKKSGGSKSTRTARHYIGLPAVGKKVKGTKKPKGGTGTWVPLCYCGGDMQWTRIIRATGSEYMTWWCHRCVGGKYKNPGGRRDEEE